MKNHCLYRYCRYSWHSDKTPGAQRLSLLLLVLAMSICWYFFKGSPVDKSWQFRELLQIPHQIGAELCVLSNCCLCLCHVRNISCWLLFSLRFIYGFGDQKTGHRFGEELGMRKVGDLWGESSKPIQGVSSFTPPPRPVPAGPRNLKGLNQIFPPEKNIIRATFYIVLLRGRCGVCLRVCGVRNPQLPCGMVTYVTVGEFDFFQREILKSWDVGLFPGINRITAELSQMTTGVYAKGTTFLVHSFFLEWTYRVVPLGCIHVLNPISRSFSCKEVRAEC